MALFTPSQSPAVVVKEIDLTGGVPNVQSSTGAIVGNFRWGPVGTPILVSNEAGLIETFASPDSASTIDFHNASYFLRYSNSLQVVREATSAAKNAQTHTSATDPTATQVGTKEEFDSLLATQQTAGQTWGARYPGEIGNSLRISVCPETVGDSAFDNWSYASSFDRAPETSAEDTAASASGTDAHVAVIDKNGVFTGTAGTVLETFPHVSVAKNSKNADGTSNYLGDVINELSNYAYFVQFDSAWDTNAGTLLTPGTAKNFGYANDATIKASSNYDLADGVNSGSLTTSEIATGFDQFEDKETIEIDFLIAPGMASSSDQATVTNDLISTAVARKDCVVVTSPARDDVVNVTNETTATTNIVSTANSLTKGSYCVMDGNYLKVYDKFNDQYIQIPAASSTAGLMAATDRNAAPWFSPAGTKRGQYLGVTTIDYNPNKTNRDTLYKAGVNPVVNLAGQGITLYGDKTLMKRPSAFDRINVRRLFLVLERAIARAAENVMFEFNDEFTRAEFVNVIEPVLRDIKGRRGITDFRIVADETVNTAAVIDRNEFIANIFIKPARSINYVTLNFVAVRTGVDFEEVVGTV